MKTRFTLSIVGALLAIGMLSNTAMAVTKTANMNVSAKLMAVAGSLSVSALSFGTLAIPGSGFQVFNSPTTITTNVTSGVNYHLLRSNGLHNIFGSTQPRMKDAVSGKFISYNLYKDSGHSAIWGYSIAGIGSTARISLTGTGGAQVTNIYATTRVQSTDKAGTYNDVNVIKLVY